MHAKLTEFLQEAGDGSGAESHVYKNCGLSSADNRTKMRDVNDELSMVFFSGWNHTQTQLIAGFDGTMI